MQNHQDRATLFKSNTTIGSDKRWLALKREPGKKNLEKRVLLLLFSKLINKQTPYRPCLYSDKNMYKNSKIKKKTIR
jgi:hypothetical protein